MTSQRVTEIVKVGQIRTFIQIVGFAGFYLPFLYNWVWLLAPHQTSLTYGVLIGLGTSALLYGPWRKTTARLARLQKYEVLFSEFFEAMIEDMEANDAEKGDTWLTRSFTELGTQMEKKFEALLLTEDDIDDHLPGLANYCAMVYSRGIAE